MECDGVRPCCCTHLLYVEDLDLRLDDEHVRIHGKGGSVRTVLLDDRGYVTLLKLYLTGVGWTAGPLFRASINGRGGPLSYDAAHHRRQSYCAAAGIEIAAVRWFLTPGYAECAAASPGILEVARC